MKVSMDVSQERRFARSLFLALSFAVMSILMLACAPAGESAYADPSVTVGNVRVSDVTSTNAFLEATAYKKSDVKVYSCGIYLGTSEAGMTKQNTEIVPDVSNAWHDGNDFDIWYDLNDELHITLEPGTTYYFKFYCTVDGAEYASGVKSFTTAGGSSVDDRTMKEHVEKQEGVRKGVNSAVAKFKDSNGVVEAEDADNYLDAAYESLKETDSDEIASIGRNDSCAWVVFVDGSVMVCAPTVEGWSSMPVDSVCSIQTYEPCNDTFTKSMEYIRMTDEAADCLSGVSTYWHRDVIKENSEVSIKALKDLGLRGGNEIILWRGHGNYVDGYGSILFIGEFYDANRRTYDEAYNAEFSDDYFMYDSDTGRLAITSKFVDEYVRDLDGALVYLGACNSGRDEMMADAWMKSGARTVVGFSDTVTTAYDGVMTRDFVKALCAKDSSGRYTNASKALDQAKAANGNSDAERYRGRGAYPKLFGDGDFCFDESLDDVYGAYLEKVQEYQARYGEHQVKTIELDGAEMYAVVGVGYVDIVDFDADGTDELIVAYGDESKLNPADPFEAYTLEVWGYENGRVKTVYSVGPHKGDGMAFEVADAVMFDIAKAKDEGKPSFVRSVAGDSVTYSTLSGGSFTSADTLRLSWSGSSMDFYVNGSKVSESEFDRVEGGYTSGDYELQGVLMGDFAWNGDPYDFEYELFLDTDNTIGRLMIGTTDAADDDYRDNGGWNEKTDAGSEGDSRDESPSEGAGLLDRLSQFLSG